MKATRRQILATLLALGLPHLAGAKSEPPTRLIRRVRLRGEPLYAGVAVEESREKIYVLWWQRSDGRFCHAGWHSASDLVAD